MKAIKAIFKTFLLSLTIVAQVHFAFAQSTQGGIVPNGKATFLDSNGKPLSSGKVYFYTQGTTTPKTTYQDINLTIPNTNPVTLDAAGRALLWGTGVYRQQVYDKNNNLIWDVTTSPGGSGSTGPTATGDGDAVGTIKPWPGASAPNQYMFTYGQELNRTTYAPLFQAITSQQNVNCSSGSPTLTGLSNTDSFWIGMKVELACLSGGSSTVASKTAFNVTLAANANVTETVTATFFMWGNGNSSTTFNLPDYRGLIPMGNNIMGGIASTNINDTYFGGNQGANSAGGQGGSQSVSITLLTSNLPAYTPQGTINTLTIPIQGFAQSGTAVPTSVSEGSNNGGLLPTNLSNSVFTGTAQGGTSTPIVRSTVQPSKTVNYIIKVTPDTAFNGTGVTSLGGMTGDIVCGTGLTCAGNTISSNNLNSIVVGTTPVSSGTTAQVLIDNGGILGQFTSAQLTAGINLATATLSGALPAWPNNTTTYFRGDGSYAGINFAALPAGISDTALGYWGTTTLSALAVTNCASALIYSTSTHSFGCNSSLGTGNVTGPVSSTVGHIAIWNNTSGTLLADTSVALRLPNPTNLYVSKTGSDSNNCLTSGTACLTIQHTVNVAQSNYDYQGAKIIINVGAGVYAESVLIFGPMTGAGTAGPSLILLGAGSSTTVIQPSGSCNAALEVEYGARVGIGSFELTGSNCSGGSDLVVISGSTAFPYDNDLVFGPAPGSLIDVTGGSTFDCNFNGDRPITIAGSSVYAFLISTQSRVITGVGVTNVISGTPAFSGAFVDAIDGSFFNWGASSTWSGSATGIRYAIALNSYIDTEQITTPLPGNSPGTVGSGSYYYTNGGIACVGSTAGCRIATAPTGFGSGATYFVSAASGDYSGYFYVTAGTSPSSSGTISLATPSIVTGPIDGGGNCTVSIGNAGSTWPAGSSVQSYYTGGAIIVSWFSNGTNLTASSSYGFNYTCQ